MRAYPYLALFTGVCAASSAAVLIRLCEAPALGIAAFRLLFASLILLPFSALRAGREGWIWSCRDGLGMGLSGICLALHFALWITSLNYTSVANSVILVSTTPLFVGLASWLLLRERISVWTTIGIVAAMVGAGVIALKDGPSSRNSLLGDALAVGGAVAMSGYLLIGRRLRQRIPALPYVSVINAVAALFLTLACLAAGAPLSDYPKRTYLLLLLLALFPQIIGHSSFNWALRRISPAFISVALLGEPILASAIAFIVLSEGPSRSALMGGPVVLAGILLAAHGEGKQAREA